MLVLINKITGFITHVIMYSAALVFAIFIISVLFTIFKDTICTISKYRSVKNDKEVSSCVKNNIKCRVKELSIASSIAIACIIVMIYLITEAMLDGSI